MGSHHAMGFGCPYSGVDTEGVEVKIPFDKRPKTRVQGVAGMWFPSSFFRFVPCRGGVRGVGVGCLVTLIVFPSQTGFTYYGRGAGWPSWFLGLWVTG